MRSGRSRRFDQVVLDELGNAEKVRIGGLVQLTVPRQAGAEGAQGPQPGDR
jgi:hypothetical protein